MVVNEVVIVKGRTVAPARVRTPQYDPKGNRSKLSSFLLSKQLQIAIAALGEQI
jgi:hypothetical protein